MKQKIAVGLSGGVDSAVSAALLKRAGFDVIGVYLHCFPENFQQVLDCTDKEDFKSAQEVAKTLKIPFTFYDFEKEYQDKVIEYFFREYKAGRTPNPDAVCNKEIKFGLFLEKALKELGVDFVATGHYARITHNNTWGPVGLHPRPMSSVAPLPAGTRRGTPAPATPRKETSDMNILGDYHLLSGVDSTKDQSLEQFQLLAGADPTKDQSYFLYDLNQDQLSRIMFPIGEYKKSKVREMAREFGLPNWQRKDSQGICFLGKVSIRKFLEQRIKPKKGEVVDISGRVIGEHDGVWFYTIGQRHGFRINSKINSGSKPILPLYVVDKDAKSNRLVVGWGKECEKKGFIVENVNWINNDGKKTKECKVRIRHLGQLYPCQLKMVDSQVEVELDDPAWGVAPGQAAVFYLPAGRQAMGDEVLGGGIIA